MRDRPGREAMPLTARGAGRTRSHRGAVALTLLVALPAVLTAGCNSLFGIHEGTPRPICVDDMTIDDLEDGDNLICRRFAGRTGGWFVFGDGSAGELVPSSDVAFTPTRIEDGSRGTSQYAARFSGSGFTVFGAFMGFDLLSPKQPFDARGLGGVTFWMRSNGPVAVDFPTEETVPVSEGGQCESRCKDHFTFQITTPVAGWYKYEVPFNALRGGGGSATWNPRHLYGVNFRVPAGAPFDLWIDDVAFYSCGGPECAPTCTDPRFPVSCSAMGGPRSSCQPPGANCAAIESLCADPSVIDDMEDGDAQICDSSGRAGAWYVASDGTGTNLSPERTAVFAPVAIPGARDASHYAARLTGSGFLAWGAAMGFSLGVGTPYDASDASGVKFWLKSDVPVTVGFPLPATTPSRQPGGTCADGAGERNCSNHFEFTVAATGSQWAEVLVPFAALRQPIPFHGNGNLIGGSASWDPSRLLSIQFGSHASAFDFWVDDVRFDNTCTGTSCMPTCAADDPVACPAAGARPAGCWPAGTDCAAPPDRIENTAVWGSGPDDVWVVGFSAVTLAGTVRHWDGVAWSSDAGGALPPLWGVWASDRRQVWAVGDHRTILNGDGATWTATAGGGGSTSPYNAVWGSDASNVWAIELPGTIRRWNGADWPTETRAPQYLNWIWGSGPEDVWAAGVDTTLHWDGSTWTAAASGTVPLTALWGSGPADIWAVGGAGTILHRVGGGAGPGTGSGWSPVASGTKQYLSGLWGLASDDVWAVGDNGTIVHWDGHGWSVVPPVTSHPLFAVWGSDRDHVWAVGRETILRWNGTAWSVER